MIDAKDSATWKLGHYIDQLLRPFVTKVLQDTTFRDETDFMRQLNVYAHDQHRLKRTTLFAALKIRNFYGMDLHENIINTVGNFIEYNSFDNRVGNVSLQTMKNLLHLYLYNNVVCFNNTIYQMTQGSPHSIPLSETLSNIYVYGWQKRILRALDGQNELFGR